MDSAQVNRILFSLQAFLVSAQFSRLHIHSRMQDLQARCKMQSAAGVHQPCPISTGLRAGAPAADHGFVTFLEQVTSSPFLSDLELQKIVVFP